MFRIILWSNYFERILVYTEATSSALLSDQRLFRAHFCLIRGDFERTLVWSYAILSALQSDQKLFRALQSSAQRSSSAHSSDQWSLRSGTAWSEVPLVWGGLIRGDFERDLNLGRKSHKISHKKWRERLTHIQRIYFPLIWLLLNYTGIYLLCAETVFKTMFAFNFRLLMYKRLGTSTFKKVNDSFLYNL